jgi:TonB family protein
LNPEVPPALDAAVLKALAREPDERYFNASDMLRDLDAVLRTYEPAPSSADLATYVRRLEAAELARRVARARDTQPPPATFPPPKKPAKPEFRITAQRPEGAAAPSAPPPAAPAPPAALAPPPPFPGLTPQPAAPVKPAPGRPRVPIPAGVFASFPEASADSEKKKRVRLYILIAAAAVVLAVVGWLVVRKPASSPPSAASVSPLPATPAVVESSITPLPTPPAVSVVEPKAAQEETQRQLAARRREMQKAAEAGAKGTRAAAEKAPPAPVLPSAAPPQARPSPEVKVAEAQPAPVEPTAVPAVEPPPTAPARAPAAAPETAAEVARGDLVGPGSGVVEPVFLSSPRIAYPPAARNQGVSGKVVVLLLVNEQGTVSEVKLQQGIPRFGVNEAVLASVRQAKFQPATKNGVAVKMWRTLVVDVKP